MILFKAVNKNYAASWAEYEKTSSYKKGARWNEVGTPVLYMSKNIQNAMLEIANYVTSPAMANAMYAICVFEFPELRLHTIEPKELPGDWADENHPASTSALGSKYLNDSANYDGIIVPSTTINHGIATHVINSVRASAYGNVVINPNTIGTAKIKLIETLDPIYSKRMFSAGP